jgi:hypothetical protein
MVIQEFPLCYIRNINELAINKLNHQITRLPKLRLACGQASKHQIPRQKGMNWNLEFVFWNFSI